MKISLLISTLVFITSTVFAQVPSEDEKRKLSESSNVTLTGDERIKQLEASYIDANKKEQSINGYRIQLFASSGAESWDRSNEVRAEFLKIYPDIPAYVIHKKPSFRVRIGDYRTRLDAERFYIEIKENFPDAFIVRDNVNFPVLDIEVEKE